TYGSRADNDLPQMARQFRDRIFFAHLRGVTRDPAEQRSFFEASHLDSDIDMVAVIRNLAENESASGREIFIRPDHGHLMLGDISKSTNPGYSAIGRMKGLAEIRGVIRAVNAQG
ncbi:MAG: mannonate dehydratase, partial [Marinomonas sp.]